MIRLYRDAVTFYAIYEFEITSKIRVITHLCKKNIYQAFQHQ